MRLILICKGENGTFYYLFGNGLRSEPGRQQLLFLQAPSFFSWSQLAEI